MASDVNHELIKALRNAHALEKQAIALLEAGCGIAGDPEIRAIYDAHLTQTREHERLIGARLEAHGEKASSLKDITMQAGALGIGVLVKSIPDTPMRLAETAFAFESFEIATYRFLHRLAERADDGETVAVVERILEQEEAAAELVAGTFDRALEVTFGEEPASPLSPAGRP